MNTIISGPPGTGKTMIAKILSRIYLCLGLTTKSTFRVVKRQDLIGEYLGHTTKKTQAVINECLGGVLFIDEAYSIGSSGGNKPGSADAYAKECIDVLTHALSEHKGELICIVAGYKEDLEKNFFSLNKGLKRRFPFSFSIESYNYKELREIFLCKLRRMKGWFLCPEINSREKLNNIFNEKNVPYFKYFGGDIDNFISRVKVSHSKRVFGKDIQLQKLITYEDIIDAFELYKKGHVHTEDKNSPTDLKSNMSMYI
jgi:SpoVK/Ycf46/Vps4 family AAA+-type ATPase